MSTQNTGKQKRLLRTTKSLSVGYVLSGHFLLMLVAHHWHQGKENWGCALEIMHNFHITTCWVPEKGQSVAVQLQDQAKEWTILEPFCWERPSDCTSFAGYCGQQGRSFFTSFLSQTSCVCQNNGFRQRFPLYTSVNSNLVDSGRGEQVEIWKWRNCLRKSGFPHEITQGIYCAKEAASEYKTCGVFGLISGKGLYKERTDAGLKGRTSNASMPIGALLCFVEIWRHFTVCDRQTWEISEFGFSLCVRMQKFRCLSEPHLNYAK